MGERHVIIIDKKNCEWMDFIRDQTIREKQLAEKLIATATPEELDGVYDPYAEDSEQYRNYILKKYDKDFPELKEFTVEDISLLTPVDNIDSLRDVYNIDNVFLDTNVLC